MKKSRLKKTTVKLPPIMETESGRFTCKVYLYHDDVKGSIYKSITADTYDEVVALALELKTASKAERREHKEAEKDKRQHRTVADAVTDYIALKENVLSPSTVVGYKRYQKNYMDAIADRELSDLTNPFLQKWINRLSAEQSPKTVSNTWGLVNSAIKMFSPKSDFTVTLPQKEKNEVAIPTKAEVEKLFTYVKGDVMELPIYLAACCGMRRSEIAGLRWENVNLEKGTIHICEASVTGKGGIVSKGTKTLAGDRVIKVYPFILDILKARAGNSSDTVCGLTINGISKRYDTIKKKLNFPYNFHALRHYCVSVMLSLNVPKKYIADYVGHETENMIDNVYGHIMQDKKTDVETLLTDYFSK